MLTNLDFGRAYLTEADGWARRFLVDLFANHTVLFVGYSHDDTIMTYLTPSLPRDDTGRRYALIGDQSDEQDRWRNLGIEPIPFPQSSENDYAGLSPISRETCQLHSAAAFWTGNVKSLTSPAHHHPLTRNLLGSLNKLSTTRSKHGSSLESADLPEWIEWLDRRGHLTALFNDGKLRDQELMLASWLSRCFALAHGDALFRTIADHRSRLNPEF